MFTPHERSIIKRIKRDRQKSLFRQVDASPPPIFRRQAANAVGTQREMFRKLGRRKMLHKCPNCNTWNSVHEAYNPSQVGWYEWCYECGWMDSVQDRKAAARLARFSNKQLKELLRRK